MRAADAQGGVLVQGVGDLEMWKTDSASQLLARNLGRTVGMLRADVWAAAEPLRNLILFSEVSGETGRGNESELYLKQYGIRYTPLDAFGIEVGKITQVVGTFAARQLSFRNPLVGTPDGYATAYPYGVRAGGSAGIFDYRVGIVSLPLYREGYVPPPSPALRPAIGAGITPMIGLRLGVSATEGPYLNRDFTAQQLHGADWKAYGQRVVAGDMAFSRGYFEAHGEVARSSYDVPGRPASVGLMYYLESKYTLTPRVFLAARYERNDYPYISPVTPTVWIGSNSVVSDGELGAGYRLGAETLLKVSVRKDHWKPNPNPNAPHDNGYAVAAQWSQTFDLMEMLTQRR
jgi:hypothetical protein